MMLVAVALSAGSLFAEGQVLWQEGGVVICDSTAYGAQAAASDDSGGVFVVWCDRRGENRSIWAQHIDRDGNALWQQNGAFVGPQPPGINQLSTISDGRGGQIATWQEGDDLSPNERHQITAQRLDATGAVLWDSSGVVVASSDSDFTYEVAAVSDGRGGAIVGWIAVPSESTGVDSLVVQRIDSLGVPCWGSPGLVMATVTVDAHVLRSDDAGGACVAWHFGGWNGYLVAQHVDSAGHPTWPGIGVTLLPPGWFLRDVTRRTDGYVVAAMTVDSMNAQRIDDQGQLLWGPDGCSVYRHGTPRTTFVSPGPDSSTFIVWTEERAERVISIYAQRLSGSGIQQWDSLGVEVGSTNDNESSVFGCVRAGAGFIASWPRNSLGPTDWDIYAQHVDTAGRLLWGDPGLGIATDSGRQMWTPDVVTDKREGAIIVWGNVYYPGVRVVLTAQRVGDVAGVAGPVLTSVARSTIQARPSPARGGSALQWPAGLGSRVAIFDASGRRVTTLLGSLSRGGDMRADWNGRDGQGRRVPPGVYVCTLVDGTGALSQKVVLTE
jgi:hypothetical protein